MSLTWTPVVLIRSKSLSGSALRRSSSASTTSALTAPGCSADTVPASWLRADSFAPPSSVASITDDAFTSANAAEPLASPSDRVLSCVMIATIGIVFGQIFDSPMKEYLPFLTAGMILWTFISTVLTEGCIGFISAEGIIKQFNWYPGIDPQYVQPKLDQAAWNKLFTDVSPQDLAKYGRPFPLSPYFKEIVEGLCDDMPEQAFYMVGTLEEAREKARKMGETK